MLLTIDQLKAILPKAPEQRLQTFLPHLNKYMPEYGIDTPIEVASFLAQVIHESGGFKWLREIWGPTSQQLKYERDFTAPWPAKKGERNWLAFQLGNEQKGDGRLFAGVGLMQTTGRKNMEATSLALFGDKRLLQNPEILATPEYAVMSACWYWKSRGLDRFDDDLDIKEETRRVNGGYNGLEDRQQIFNRAVAVFVK